MSTAPDNPSPSEKCSPWLLFAMPIGLGFGLGVVVSIVKSLQEVDTRSIYLGLDGLRAPLAIGGLSLVVFVLGMLYFRPTLKRLLVGSLIFAALAIVAAQLVRIDSFYGNMIPRLAWRWQPTAEQQVKSYFVSATSRPAAGKEVASSFAESDNDFPQFLGRNRNGTVSNVQLSSDWQNRPPKLLWNHPVGLGWSSFATVGEAAIGIEQRDASECVVCYHLRTGEELWCYSELNRFDDEHGAGPRSTPTIYRDRVYTMGAQGTLSCLDLHTGKRLWSQATLKNPEQQNLLWGMSGSPLIFDDFVLVTPGAGEGAAAIAYSAEKGHEVWRSGDDRAAYASPVEVEICGERQLLSFNGEGLRAYAIDGTPLWLFPWLTQGESQRVNVAQPVLVPSQDTTVAGRVLVSSGYDNGTAMVEVRQAGDDWTVETVWVSKHLKSKMSNFIVTGDTIYGLDNGILTCLDLATGQRIWKRGRYGHGQMLLVGDKLLIQAENGEVVMVAADRQQHVELAKFAALSSKTWNHLNLTGNILLVRNDREAAAYELPTE